MLKAGTKLKVLHNGKVETVSVGYCDKQFAIITQGYQILSPAFFSQDEDLNIIDIRTKNDIYHVIDLVKPYNQDMTLYTFPDYYREFHLGYADGDMIVFASLESSRYECLRLEPNMTQSDINKRIKDMFDSHLLAIAVYKCQSSPYLDLLSDMKQYGVWWERDRVDLDKRLEEALKDLKMRGYKRLVPNEITEFNEADDSYMLTKYDRMDKFFPLYSIEYSIDELLETKVIAVLPMLWKGYQKFLKDFCEGSEFQ